MRDESSRDDNGSATDPSADIDVPTDATADPAVDDTPATSVDIARLRAENASLQVALGSNRFIGAAVGIIMITKYLTYDAAFEYLRALSQRSNRKIRELADEIVMTGEVPPMPSD